ncbi:MAG: NYN domain-containing protein [Acidobacteriaceae bacterium]|nr:NYN domain-containing protein [Acidobacteriaceae bacterium]
MRTNLYIDGFNFYYGAARHTPYKWANVVDLAELIFPTVKIHQAHYFTALVKPTPNDPDQRQRQMTYLRALETLPNLKVHYGHYLQSQVMMKVVNPPPDYIRVFKMEEKGSDVNLATRMLVDAFRDDCDQFIVITNDSDLAEPIRIINSELKKRVLILNPHSQDSADRRGAREHKKIKANPSSVLARCAHRVKDITSNGQNCHMALCQFPVQLMDAAGRTIHKPVSW